MRETERSELVLANVTMETRGWSEARKEPQAKACRQLLEAENGQKTDPSPKLLEGTESY